MQTDALLYLLETDGGEGGAGGEGGEGGEEQQAPPAQESWTPSREEWDLVMRTLPAMAERVFAEPEQEDDQEEIDFSDPKNLARFVTEYVDGRFGEAVQFSQPAVEEAGNRRMQSMFDELQKDPEIGEFDRELAKDISEVLWVRAGGQGDPQTYVRQAAVRAAQIRKQERMAGREDYKTTLKRPVGEDFGVAGGGEGARPPAKTYDEVVSRWAGDEDV